LATSIIAVRAVYIIHKKNQSKVVPERAHNGVAARALAYLPPHLFSTLLLLPPLLNTTGWPTASLLLAPNWKALIIRPMADSDVCQRRSVRQPRPSALSGLSLATRSERRLRNHYSSSGASHPDHVADRNHAQHGRGLGSNWRWRFKIGVSETISNIFKRANIFSSCLKPGKEEQDISVSVENINKVKPVQLYVNCGDCCVAFWLLIDQIVKNVIES